VAYWLLKADPDDYGYEHLQKDKKTVWDGVGNNLALKHIRQMKKGDLALIYHSGKEKAVVGLATITSNPYPDPDKADERLVVFDIKPKKRFAKTVTLAAIKAEARFADFALVRMSRLSVMPVPAALWKRLLSMAGEKAG
jgi:predicted RNA-binding protein with PUA-like domain